MKVAISPFSTLTFRHDEPRSYMQQEEFIQPVLVGDRLKVQLSLEDSGETHIVQAPIPLAPYTGAYVLDDQGNLKFDPSLTYVKTYTAYVNAKNYGSSLTALINNGASFSDLYIVYRDAYDNITGKDTAGWNEARPIPLGTTKIEFPAANTGELPYVDLSYRLECDIIVRNLHSDKWQRLNTRQVGVMDDYTYYETHQVALNPGCYSYEVYYDEKMIARAFYKIVDYLPESFLFRYKNDTNTDGTIFDDYFFFRCEGAIPLQNISLNAESNNFRDQLYSLQTLSGFTSNIHKMIIGSSKGVSRWVIEKMNRILCCTEVYMDGRRIARSESSAPEQMIYDVTYPLYMASVDIEYEDKDNIFIETVDSYDVVTVDNNMVYNVVTAANESVKIKA